jgi:hypothetical protein
MPEYALNLGKLPGGKTWYKVVTNCGKLWPFMAFLLRKSDITNKYKPFDGMRFPTWRLSLPSQSVWCPDS